MPPTQQPQPLRPEQSVSYTGETSKAPLILGILLALALVGAAVLGYLYYTQQQTAADEKMELENQVALLRSDLKEAQATPSPSPSSSPAAPQVLAIKEWKVQLALPTNGSLAGLAYTYDAKTDAASFGGASFDAKAPGCTTAKGDFGLVTRVTKGKPVAGSTKLTTIGAYDYFAATTPTACGKMAADEQARVSLRNAVLEAVKAAVATP